MKMVKLTTLYCGAKGTFPAGTEMSLPDAESKMLVDGGYAEHVNCPVEPVEPTAPVERDRPAKKPEPKQPKK